jgi:cell wall-associated NlpC family hydrolase
VTRLVEPLTDDERLEFVATARTHAKARTRFKHCGRSKFGLDCVGLIRVCLSAVGREVEDRKRYGRSPEDDRLREAMRLHFGMPITDDPRPGDVPLMRWDIRPQHVGLLGDYVHGGLSLIHADAMFGAVVEHSFSGDWIARTIEVYRP